jgi:hypothetical protein
MPERCGELELGLQPMVERSSYRFAFLLPDEIGTHLDFIFGNFRTSVGHMHFCHTVTSAKESNYSMILRCDSVFSSRVIVAFKYADSSLLNN